MYVYELVNPLTQSVFYVGKGSGNRYLHHEKEALLSPTLWTNVHKCQTILSILASGSSIIYNIHECADEEVAYNTERDLIKRYGRLCDGTGCLTNLLPGGNGGKPLPVYVFRRDNGLLVGKYESRREASSSLGVSPSSISESINGNSKGSRLYIFSESPNPPNSNIKDSIAVYKLPTKELVGVFVSTYEAAGAIGVSQTMVHNCLNGTQERIYGKYVVIPSSLPVPQYEIIRAIHINTGEIVDYASLHDAVTATNIDRSSIIRSIKSDGCSRAGKFHWFKANL